MKPKYHTAITPDGIKRTFCRSRWAKVLNTSESMLNKKLGGKHPYQKMTMQQIVDEIKKERPVFVDVKKIRNSFLCRGTSTKPHSDAIPFSMDELRKAIDITANEYKKIARIRMNKKTINNLKSILKSTSCYAEDGDIGHLDFMGVNIVIDETLNDNTFAKDFA